MRNSSKTAPKRAKKPTRGKLIKEADTLLSMLVRRKFANKDGYVACYTCTYVAPWKKLQNGHYISRWYKHTRWDMKNCRPQCFGCNIRMSGNSHIFRAKLVEELGEEEVQAMEAKSRLIFKEKDEYILAIINKLKEELKQYGV